MPRVTHVKSAAKDQPDYGIVKGDSYYWWKFRFGGKRVSKTYPKQSQLTQSEYMGALYDLQDEIEDAAKGCECEDDFQSLIEDYAGRLRDLGQEQSDKKDNMPDALQDSSTGELLQERADACEAAAEELESIDLSFEELEENDQGEKPTEEEIAEHLDEYCERIREEIGNISYE